MCWVTWRLHKCEVWSETSATRPSLQRPSLISLTRSCSSGAFQRCPSFCSGHCCMCTSALSLWSPGREQTSASVKWTQTMASLEEFRWNPLPYRSPQGGTCLWPSQGLSGSHTQDDDDSTRFKYCLVYLFIYVRLNTWQSIEPDQFKGFTPDVNWKCKTVKHGWWMSTPHVSGSLNRSGSPCLLC